jgi:hypothetical protein
MCANNVEYTGRIKSSIPPGRPPSAPNAVTAIRSRSHYLALVCADDELERRLRARPGWRRSDSEPFIQTQLDFNRWFVEQGVNGQPPVELLDTTAGDLAQTAQKVGVWIRARLSGN